MCSTEFLADFYMADVCMRKARPFGRVFRGVSDTVWQDFRGVRFGSSRPFYALAQTTDDFKRQPEFRQWRVDGGGVAG